MKKIQPNSIWYFINLNFSVPKQSAVSTLHAIVTFFLWPVQQFKVMKWSVHAGAGRLTVYRLQGNLQTLQTLTTDMYMQLALVKHGRAAPSERQELWTLFAQDGRLREGGSGMLRWGCWFWQQRERTAIELRPAAAAAATWLPDSVAPTASLLFWFQPFH